MPNDELNLIPENENELLSAVEPEPEPEQEPRRTMWPWWLVTVLLVLVTAAATHLLTKRSVLAHLPEPVPVHEVDTIVDVAPQPVVQKNFGPSVLRIAYPDSDDGFVNVRTQPHSDAPIVAEIVGLELQGNAIILSREGSWTLVKCGGHTGYAYSKYISEQTWYSGKGDRRLVAATTTPIYFETEEDGPAHGAQLGTIEAGTIIGDKFSNDDTHFRILDRGNYYYLATGFEGYLIPKRTVSVETAQ